MKKFLLSALVCAGLIALPAMAEEDAAKAIEEAKVAYQDADSRGFAWRDTSKMIKQAEKAAADGDPEKAIKLATQAKAQSEAAIAQAARESNAGPRI
jgi:hypothetical protein